MSDFIVGQAVAFPKLDIRVSDEELERSLKNWRPIIKRVPPPNPDWLEQEEDTLP